MDDALEKAQEECDRAVSYTHLDVYKRQLMYRSARGAFELVDENVLNAARTLGIPERKVFWKILMPVSYTHLISRIYRCSYPFRSACIGNGHCG